MIMKNLFLLFGAAAAIGFYGCSKDDDNAAIINPQDRSLIIMASLNNVAEMALGQLAADSSQTPAIKEFGQMMVNDHANAQGGLVALASQYGVTPHDTPDQEHIALLQKLLTLKGREFDSLYIHSQVADHFEAVTLFQTAYDLGNNRELGTYITSTLPTLQQHLQHAQALAQDY